LEEESIMKHRYQQASHLFKEAAGYWLEVLGAMGLAAA